MKEIKYLVIRSFDTDNPKKIAEAIISDSLLKAHYITADLFIASHKNSYMIVKTTLSQFEPLWLKVNNLDFMKFLNKQVQFAFEANENNEKYREEISKSNFKQGGYFDNEKSKVKNSGKVQNLNDSRVADFPFLFGERKYETKANDTSITSLLKELEVINNFVFDLKSGRYNIFNSGLNSNAVVSELITILNKFKHYSNNSFQILSADYMNSCWYIDNFDLDYFKENDYKYFVGCNSVGLGITVFGEIELIYFPLTLARMKRIKRSAFLQNLIKGGLCLPPEFDRDKLYHLAMELYPSSSLSNDSE